MITGLIKVSKKHIVVHVIMEILPFQFLTSPNQKNISAYINNTVLSTKGLLELTY